MLKCNVAQFISSIQDGGAETLVRDYALMLDKEKMSVIVIVMRRLPDTANDCILREQNTKIITIYNHNSLPMKIIQKLNCWWYVPVKLKRILKREDINVLHVHLSLLKYVSKIRKYLKDKKILYTCHNLPALFFRGKEFQEFIAAKKLIKDNQFLIIALHEDMRKEINNMFNINNTVVIRNGIDFKKFRDVKEKKTEIRRLMGIPDEAYVVGHIGRFSEQKNHDYLIDIFNEIHKRRPNAFLLLIGAGELETKIREKLRALNLSDNVMILSHRSDIPQLLKAMDVFVFPSRYEGLGIVLIEAQVLGLRCVVSDSVPKEAFQTELAVPVSLNEPPYRWAEIILDDSIKGKANGNIDDYDMNKEIRRLESLYLSQNGSCNL